MGRDTPRSFLNRTFFARLTPALMLATFCLISSSVFSREIAGWVEHALLLPSGIELKAKLDTGAKTSSINALKMDLFDQDGNEYVRFTVKNKQGDTIELVELVIRHVTIKRHFGKSQKRPVVLLTICIGNSSRVAEVNLVDRAGFNYPLLLGRSFLKGEFLIDPGSTYNLGSGCLLEQSQ